MELEFESSAVVWLFGAPGRHRARGTERGGELPLPSTLLLTMALLLLLLLLLPWPAAVLFCSATVAMAAAICRLVVVSVLLTYSVSDSVVLACRCSHLRGRRHI